MDSEPTDEQLIERFLAGEHQEAEGAFRRMVTRHGPMVMGVCRQVLKQVQDAEDAFQATFLILARRATTIRDRRVLRTWLYEVASRQALRMRARVARRHPRPRLTIEQVSPGEAQARTERDELRLILDAELDRLPESYRILLVQCYLEGKSGREVARLHGCPVGTIKGRLSRARGMLRGRLLGRGGLQDHRGHRQSPRESRSPAGLRMPAS
jgi:RNA polymerase sigma factor (sigma-70 family)